MLAKSREVGLVGMDVQGEREALVGPGREAEQRPQRVSLLAVADAVVLDRAVCPEVRHGGEGIGLDPVGDRPALEHDRRQRVDPVVARGRHPAADGHVVGVAVQAHVHPLRVPQLVERRVEVEVDPDRSPLEDTLVAEHPRDVQEQVGNRAAVRPEERPRAEVEPGEVGSRLGARLGRVDQPHLVTELLEAEHVLEHRPGRPALVRIGRDHACDEDPHNACSSSSASTLSESKCSSATARAARACRS